MGIYSNNGTENGDYNLLSEHDAQKFLLSPEIAKVHYLSLSAGDVMMPKPNVSVTVPAADLCSNLNYKGPTLAACPCDLVYT